jgi:hypothetical protein
VAIFYERGGMSTGILLKAQIHLASMVRDAMVSENGVVEAHVIVAMSDGVQHNYGRSMAIHPFINNNLLFE